MLWHGFRTDADRSLALAKPVQQQPISLLPLGLAEDCLVLASIQHKTPCYFNEQITHICSESAQQTRHYLFYLGCVNIDPRSQLLLPVLRSTPTPLSQIHGLSTSLERCAEDAIIHVVYAQQQHAINAATVAIISIPYTKYIRTFSQIKTSPSQVMEDAMLEMTYRENIRVISRMRDQLLPQ